VAEIASAEIGESPENTSEQVEETEAEAVELTASDAIAQTPDSSGVAEGEKSAGVWASEVESSATQLSIALHPHDLDDRIPGLAELHNQTLGDPRITIDRTSKIEIESAARIPLHLDGEDPWRALRPAALGQEFRLVLSVIPRAIVMELCVKEGLER
jgi:hypothetical protein